MKDFHSITEKILGGVLTVLWFVTRPLVWVYALLKWFTISVTKEVGNRVVKIVGGFVAMSIVAYFFQFFLR